MVEGSKLDIVAHFGGLVVGTIAHRPGKWLETHKEAKFST